MEKLKSKMNKLLQKKSTNEKKEEKKEKPKIEEPKVRKIEDYYDLSTTFLGSGSFASVKQAQNRKTGEQVAVKVQEKTDDVDDSELFEEVKLQKQFVHPHVVRIYDVFETDEHHYIVQELMQGGMLFDIIAEAREISEAQASQVMREILLGIKHLHDRGVAHRDLKPENVLCVSKKWPLRVKLGDFGFASTLKSDGETENKDFVGSPDYLAPEIARSEPHGKEVDIWSCGVILYILLTGMMPFGGDSVETEDKLDNIAIGRYDFPDLYWGNISGTAISLVQSMMQLDPKKRLTAEAALHHEFLEKPELLKRTPTGNDMSGIHSSKFKKTVIGIMATKRMQTFLHIGK